MPIKREYIIQKQADTIKLDNVHRRKEPRGLLWELGLHQLKRKRSDYLKCYLDTNIFIEYLWRYFFSENASKNTASCRLIQSGAEGKFEIYFSEFTVMEITQHFIDYFLMQKVISDGYSFREFSKMKKKYEITEDESLTINQLTDRLINNQYLNYIVMGSSKNEEKFLMTIIPYVKHYIDFMDAIHIRMAIAADCDYFVTEDSELRIRIQKLLSKKLLEKPIKITTPKGMLSTLRLNNK